MKKRNSGMSLIEVLVVITLFVVIVGFVGQTLFASLRASSKSKVTTRIKQDANYVTSVMERSIHSASSFVGSSSTGISYIDENGNTSSFSCAGGTVSKTVSGNTQTLISNESIVSSCAITVSSTGGGHTVGLNMTLTQSSTDSNLRPEEKSSVTINTSFRFRN